MKTVQKDKYLPESVKIKIGKNIFDADKSFKFFGKINS